MNITNEPQTDFTCFALLNRAADYFAKARKPRAEWKKLDDLAAQLAEFDLRSAAGEYDTAASVLAEMDYDYLLLWGHYRLIIYLYESITEKIKDRNLHMGSFFVLGLAYQSIGYTRKSIFYFEQGIATARESKNRQAESAFIGNLGFAYSALGELRKAIEYYEHSLVTAREIGDRRGEGVILGNLGLAYTDLGDTRKAIEFYEQSLLIDSEIGDRSRESINRENKGHAFVSLEEYQKAKENFQQAIQIADEISNLLVQQNARNGLAEAYLIQNDLTNARAAIEAALQYDVPENNHNASALHGIIALRQGDEVAAQGAFVRAIGQADEILSKTAEYYDALDAKGLAICGLAICDLRLKTDDGRGGSRSALTDAAGRGAVPAPDDAPTNTTGRGDPAPTVNDAIETFHKARKIAPHAGVVKSVLRLFDELVKCDGEGVLKDVRKAVEGK